MTTQETNTSTYRMLGLLLILLGTVNLAVTSPLQDKEARSEKRGLIEMAKIIEYYTKRSAFDYNGYGCYCGLGGSGVPVDAVDRCCKGHDDCYSGTSCWVTHLSWSTSNCSGGRCVCQDKVNSCGYEACQCDVTLGRCLATAPYIKSNYGTCKKGSPLSENSLNNRPFNDTITITNSSNSLSTLVKSSCVTMVANPNHPTPTVNWETRDQCATVRAEVVIRPGCHERRRQTRLPREEADSEEVTWEAPENKEAAVDVVVKAQTVGVHLLQVAQLKEALFFMIAVTQLAKSILKINSTSCDVGSLGSCFVPATENQ